MSRLDRIWWSPELDGGNNYKVQTDWTYTQSDHCAVIVKLKNLAKLTHYKIVRLDTFFMSNVILKQKFITELNNRFDQIKETQMNPHQILEFLKMAIRSIAIEISSNHKKAQELEMNTLRKDIDFWQRSIETAASDLFKEMAIDRLDELICKRNKILNEKGEFLSNCLQSKWYQEGERGTKYFLNMQRAKGKITQMESLQCDSEEINDPDQIDTMVLEYYRKLYEKGDSKKSTNSATANIFLRNMTKLDDDIINMIDAPITTLDLYNTLRSCRDSAPGPDGIPYSIIKLTWSIFGPALVNAWNYSLLTSELTNSHTDSYLKLLPKAGKNLLLLKNWRPITLSNCDFKVITKTLASRLTNGLSNMISHNQTAYIKGRQITDNLHLLQYAIEKAVEIDESTSIVSLDAEKAFDSIEHWYIREILDKIGLSKFKLLFDIIYRDQKVSIQLNSRCAGTYNIKNGVKQGDALSCILFILGIEPLLKNISADNNIKGVTIEGREIPKIVSYADDVACIIKPGNSNLQQIFNHYQEMTDCSGLRLNADKTELISWLGNDQSYKIIYEGNEYNIAPCDNMKVNGLQIGFNLEDMRVINFEKVYSSVDCQLITWSNRYLSLLAKILIFKTFGLSQILFVASTTMFSKAQDNKLTTLIY